LRLDPEILRAGVEHFRIATRRRRVTPRTWLPRTRQGCCSGRNDVGRLWIVLVSSWLAAAPASATPIGAFGGGGGAYARMRSGFFLGAETGLALSTGGDVTAGGAARVESTPGSWWTFGACTGYEWENGIALQLRVDDLGTRAGDGSSALTVASAGARYSLPFIVMPFVDALVGPAFESGNTSLAAALGVGGSVLITRHLAFDLAFRDWMTDLGSNGIRHVPTVTLGVQIGFGR